MLQRLTLTAALSAMTAVPAMAGYEINQGSDAPTYSDRVLNFDEEGGPTGIVDATAWQESLGIVIDAGDGIPQVGAYDKEQGGWGLGEGNSFFGNFGVFMTFDHDVTAMSLQIWDPSGPPTPFGGGIGVFLFNDGEEVANFFTTPAWGGVGEAWLNLSAGDGDVFDEVRVLGYGFPATTYADNLSWDVVEVPGYEITQGTEAPAYSDRVLTFDEDGTPTGVVPADTWQESHGIIIDAGDGVPQVGDYDAEQGGWGLGDGNSYFGNFGVFMTFDADIIGMSLQVWDPAGPPSPFGGGLGVFLFNDGEEVSSFFTTPAWGGLGDEWFNIAATGGTVFDEVRILGFGFPATTYVDNLSWERAEIPTYAITQGTEAPAYSDRMLTFDEDGTPTGVVPADTWQESHGIIIDAGDGQSVVGDFDAEQGGWGLGEGNSFFGNFGVFMTFDADIIGMSLQVWDPSGPPSPFGGGLGVFLFNDGEEVSSFFTTPAWGGLGDAWFNIAATGGAEFDEVRILGFGFPATTYVDNLSWERAEIPTYTITQGTEAPAYSDRVLTFDEEGTPTGVVPANTWQTSHGIIVDAGDGVPQVGDYDAEQGGWGLGEGNSFFGNFGVFMTLEGDATSMSLQVWDPAGPPSPFGGGLGVFLFNDGEEVASIFTTPAWGGLGDAWFDIAATGGAVFDEVRILGFGFPATTYADNISWDVVCPADVNGSGVVDVDDLVAVILGWGGNDPTADINNDGVVDVDDLTAVILAWDETC